MGLNPENPATLNITGVESIPRAPSHWRLWALGAIGIGWGVIGLILTPVGEYIGVLRSPVPTELATCIYGGGLVLVLLSMGLHLRRSQAYLSELLGRIDKQNRRLRGMATDLEAVRSLLKITASINSQMDLPSLLRMIAREAVEVLKADRSSVMLLDSSRTILKIVAAYGCGLEPLKDSKVRLGEGVAGWVAQYGKPRLIHGDADPKEFKALRAKDPKIVSAACVPLQVGGRVLGVLNVSLTQEQREFKDEELRLLMLYANHAAVAIRNAALLKASQERAALRSILEGYVSPQVARVLIKDPGGWINMGDMREITVLFADIRGFTGAVQHIGPELIRSFLNEYFTKMTEEVFRYQGTVDKFIGDSIMAFFGAPLRVENSAKLAVQTAIAMMRAFSEMVHRWSKEHPIVGSLSLGAGISSGKMFVGNIGSEKRFDYTVIGPDVNVASRLCSMAQGWQILVTHSTEKSIRGIWPVRHMGDVRFKGLEGPIHVFEVSPEGFSQRDASKGELWEG